MSNFKAWLGQVTTGHAMMVLTPTVLAVLSGQMAWRTAVPLLAAACVGLIWPENSALAAAAETTAKDAMAVASAYENRGVTKPLAALVIIGMALGLLTACSSSATKQALATQPGQLFCAIATQGGGSFVAGLVKAEVAAKAPGFLPVAVLATDAGKAAVDSDCAKAAASVVGAVAGVPVSPPPVTANVPQLAIVSPASPVASPPAS